MLHQDNTNTLEYVYVYSTGDRMEVEYLEYVDLLLALGPQLPETLKISVQPVSYSSLSIPQNERELVPQGIFPT